MRTLKLPPTIRAARPEEAPNQEYILNTITDSTRANITEGYVMHYNETHKLPFTFFAEINIDNDRLWLLFKTLLLQLPDEICLVYNYKNGEPSYSRHTDKYKVLNNLYKFQLEITQDGFFEIGALFNDTSMMEEVFIRSSKYLLYWGVDEIRFKQTLAKFGLYEVPGLNFIDQFPMVIEPLWLYHSNIIETNEVLKQFGIIDLD